MKTSLRNLWLAVGTALAVVACGGGDAPGAAAQQTASAAGVQAVGADACSLLSREDVNAVVPGNEGGQERDASEAALLENVTIDFCRYFHVEGTNMKYLDLLVYEASTDEAFKQIEIGKWAHQGSSRQLDFGDLGFLLDMSDQNEIVATVSKGRTVIELKLNADDAAARSVQLVALARIVTAKIGA